MGSDCGEPLSVEPVHFGVNDGIEVRPGLRVCEHDAAECGTVEGCVRREHRVPKPLVDGTQTRRAWSHRLARESIGVDDDRTEERESRRDDGLARRDSACEPDDIHAATLSR